MKRNIIIFCVLLSISGLAFAQQNTVANAYVKAALTETEINGILSADPNGILYYNYLTEEGWFIMDIPEEKPIDTEVYPYLYKMDRTTKQNTGEVLSINDLPAFNLLLYRYKISPVRNYYLVEGSRKVLVVRSHAEITGGFNHYKN
ncbi:MAG TPA: hypothetical protein PLB59_10380 [Bacteroidales bacterium]|jgi:hypothetical protein|nr:hypothetical protein [Bacteroidales bacterium]HNZ42577.1 hypothetical protein [Bacteroidales bacterium]HPB25960.1 hypothetical protein [Bacteroidales bacterium]HPI30838.1 hypothetical protein [Bacteroidales bacterium]HQN16476.1 hypothetical protein [Bacteroidales bacterium]